MHVWVDQAREEVQTARVDRLVRRVGNLRRDRGDRAVGDADVGAGYPVAQYDVTISNDEVEHQVIPERGRCVVGDTSDVRSKVRRNVRSRSSSGATEGPRGVCDALR